MAPRALTAYRLLIRAFPRAFRDRFGDDLTDVFADRLREARRTGRFAVAALWLRSVADVAAHATAERRIAHAMSTRSGGYMSGFGSDVVTALRGFIRRPGFTLAIGLMLAVGLGFNTALFAVVQSVLFRPLPYAKPDRIMMLSTGRNPDGTGGVSWYADYLGVEGAVAQLRVARDLQHLVRDAHGRGRSGGDRRQRGVAGVLPRAARADRARARHRARRRGRASRRGPADCHRAQPVAASLPRQSGDCRQDADARRPTAPHRRRHRA